MFVVFSIVRLVAWRRSAPTTEFLNVTVTGLLPGGPVTTAVPTWTAFAPAGFDTE